ncbi:MAG TPA: ABC transporter substrate-binding protein [Candidatus Aquilonibacter sp.]
MTLSLSRRSFVAASAAAAAAFAIPTIVRAQPKLEHIRLGFGTASISPIIINLLLPQYLGYYRDEGLDVEPIPLGSNVATLTNLMQGRVQFGTATPSFDLPILARGEPLPVVNFYEYTYPFKYGLAVLPSSSIRTMRDCKGKHIGVSGFGESEYPVGQALFRLIGMDPDKDVTWLAVGGDVAGGVALTSGKIDALMQYDTGFGAIEAAGIALRYLKLPGNTPKVGGFFIDTTRETYGAHRDWAIGMGRAAAKASIFILENPEAAAYGFMQLFPEAVPKGKSLKEQIAAISIPIRKRMPLYRNYNRSITKWGYLNKREWQDEIVFGNFEGKVKDVGQLNSNDLIDQINHFDPQKIVAQARAFKIPSA